MILAEKFLLPADIDDAERQAIVHRRARQLRGISSRIIAVFPGEDGWVATKRPDSERIKPFADIIRVFAEKCLHVALPAHIGKQRLFRSECLHRRPQRAFVLAARHRFARRESRRTARRHDQGTRPPPQRRARLPPRSFPIARPRACPAGLERSPDA
jgi:hypothetical protein